MPDFNGDQRKLAAKPLPCQISDMGVEVSWDLQKWNGLDQNPQLIRSYLDLLEKHFPRGHVGPKGPNPIEKEFSPLLVDPTTRIFCAFRTSDQRILASVATVIRSYRCPQSSVPLSCLGIGLVVTDPEFQGYGLASQLLSLAEKERPTTLSVLWSDKISFYDKRGYVACGTEAQWTLPASTTKFRELPKGTPPIPFGWERSASWRSWLTTLNGTHVLEITSSYALLGKGRDMHKVIYELGGPAEYWPQLIEKAIAQGAEKLVLPYHSEHRKIIESLSPDFGSPEIAPMALVKCLDVRTLVRWIQSVEPRLPLTISASGDAPTVKIGSRFETTDPSHLLQLFMGPLRPEDITDLPELTKKELEPFALPLPFYIWGVESV